MNNELVVPIVVIYYVVIAISFMYFQYKFFSLYKEKIDHDFPNPVSSLLEKDGSFSTDLSSERFKKYLVIFKAVNDKEIEKIRRIYLFIWVAFFIPIILYIVS